VLNFGMRFSFGGGWLICAVVTACGGRAEDNGSEASGGSQTGGSQASGGSESGGSQASGGSESGGSPSVPGAGGTSTPTVAPEDVGHVEQSCGAGMWSRDGSTFLVCTPGGEHEFHPDCEPADCTVHGDVESICVFSNHCWCSDGFVCESGATLSGSECEPRFTCVPSTGI
jgi:hypothetical protein